MKYLLAAETAPTEELTLWEEVVASLKTFFLDNWLNVVYFFVALFIGIVLVKIILRITRSVLARSKMEKITQSFLLSLLKFVLYLLLILILAQIIGIPITGLVALISAAGLAVSLALQDSLSNLANGIIIISSKPFHEGDYVQINGVEGTVKNIRMLTTALVTPDNKLIVLPNSNIVTNEIVNYNVLGRRRVDLTFSVAYESDLKQVCGIISEVIRSDGRTLEDPVWRTWGLPPSKFPPAAGATRRTTGIFTIIFWTRCSTSSRRTAFPFPSSRWRSACGRMRRQISLTHRLCRRAWKRCGPSRKKRILSTA